jgi:RNA polymerase sigma factor (sigma-70 family)
MDDTAGDAALVQAVRDGNRDAFAPLLVRHWSLLLSLSRRMLGDADLAHDAAQEAALQAFLSLDRLQKTDQFGPWLSGIGLNVCRHWLRRQRQAEVSWDAVVGGRHDPARDLPDEHLGPAERAEMADLRVRVQQAVDGLPRGQRAAIVLYYLCGLTYAETAAHLGIEVGAVKTRLHKARGTLRQRLWELWEEQEMVTPAQPPLVDMQIDSARRNMEDPNNPRHVMILRESAGPRYLMIWVGAAEAEALGNALQHTEMPRPMTFTFMANMLQAAAVTLREVQINRLVDDVFYATAIVEGANGTRTVDARPSDALNLAALTGAPIRVAPTVLDALAFTVQKQTIADENGREVIEQVVRQASTGEVIDHSHLDPVNLAPIRVLFRQAWKTTTGSAESEPQP